MTENKKVRGRGRPKASPENVKGVIIQLRVTEEEAHRIADEAEKAGKTVSELIREKVLGST
jgi:(2Fe-2S) ferredoxin